MPDWRDNEIEGNIRDGLIQSSNLDIDASHKKSRLELDSIPTNDLTENQKPTNNDGFGVITNKPFKNGSASVARGPVENGGNAGSYGENDFGYYDWPAIDNFEDVDRLFRNCDSTYGQRETMEDGGEELSWFANSSDALYASEMEALTDFTTYSSSKPGPHTSADAEVEDAFASNQMECESEEMEQLVANQTYNECSLNGTLDMTGNPQLAVQDLVDQKCSSVSTSVLNNLPFLQNQNHQVEPGSSSYLTFNSYPGMNGSASPIQPPAQKGPSVIRKKVERLNSVQLPLTEKLSFYGANGNSDFEKGDSESKNMLASSMVLNGSTNNNSSAFSTNDLSVEETSFMQLQDVMNQLDVPTKICIRDGLYRLARSVQQRNDYSNTSSSYGNGNAQYSAINNGFVEPINPETGTNPIDRSIAELLFHQPPDSTPNSGSAIKNIEAAASPKSHVSNENNNNAPAVVVPCSERQILISSDRNSTK